MGAAEGGERNITFHFRKTKTEITSPYTRPRVLRQKAADLTGLQQPTDAARGAVFTLAAAR